MIMKKFFMFIVAAVTLVSCGGADGPIGDITNLYQDATSEVLSAGSVREINTIAAELEAEISQYYADNKDECNKLKAQWDAYATDKKNVPENIEYYDALKAAMAKFDNAVSKKKAELANEDAEAEVVNSGFSSFTSQVESFISDYNSSSNNGASKGEGGMMMQAK